ncbi:glucosamine--fructose-6-phosphate aminotransferase [Aureimonas sp. SA4125]|uniref:SIS domain-containing protein n=1 Tax=Aureimonas sp. SA4125 TaxID=2826993 RepID=UPI001CC34825|nr:SIS domain-containing protein [Aureimonas sp. SA4125]BDA86189.1 glucosamine--fructose-6-phosphate aminotransferase [Aureimonas sp. SA4125]
MPPAAKSFMRREINETPEALRRLLSTSGEAMEAAGMALRQVSPPVVVTIARGSSDHAAAYFKYAAEISTGVPVASLGPSVVSIYGARLKLAGAAALAISQSGRSPDIVSMLTAARLGGARTLALVNVPGSPLEAAADHVVPLAAGLEHSVAATKSFLVSVAASLGVLAAWTGDTALRGALERLPDQIEEALLQDWSPAIEAARDAGSLYTLGRGVGHAIAAEAALKFKETSLIHAEAYSGAELLHGPVSLVDGGFPVFVFAPDDAAHASLVDLGARLEAKGAHLFVAGEGVTGRRLPTVATGHPLTAPLTMLVSFYGFIEEVARARELDPDVPRGLSKVTETI